MRKGGQCGPTLIDKCINREGKLVLKELGIQERSFSFCIYSEPSPSLLILTSSRDVPPDVLVRRLPPLFFGLSFPYPLRRILSKPC